MVDENEDVGEGSDSEAIRQALEQDKAIRNLWRPKEVGEWLVRIVPPPIRGLYYYEFGQHWDINAISPNFGSRRSCGCAKMAYGQDCALCKLADHMYFMSRQHTIRPEDKELYENTGSNIRARYRVVMNMYLSKQPDKGMLIWSIGREANDLIRPLFADWGDITNSKTGRDLVVRFHKKERFILVQSVTPRPKQTPIELPNWKEQRHDLEAYIASLMIPNDELEAAVAAAADNVEHFRNWKSSPPHSDDDAPDENGDPGVVPGEPDESSPPDTPPPPADEEKADPIAALAKEAGVPADDENVRKVLEKMQEKLKKK